MTLISARRIAFGAAALTAFGTVTAVAPALATSPSYPVVCATAHEDAPRNTLTTFTLSCEDADGNAVDSYAIVTQPTKAAEFSLNTTTGVVSYRPLAGADGTDTFTFKGVIDGLGESAPTAAVVTLENERPVCEPVAALTVGHDDSVVVPLACEDADVDALTITQGTTGAAHGTVAIDDDVVTYTPAAKYVGTDTFSLRATDGDLLSENVTVNVTVTNARPTCAAGSLSTLHDTAKTVSFTCTDADGDALTSSVVAKAQHGTVALAGGKLTYKPAKGFVGNDTFTVAATDGIAAAVPARFTVKVTNAVPTCKPAGKLTVKAGTATPVKLVCTDGDKDGLTVVVVDAPDHGKLVRKGASWIYTPAKKYAGKDSFKLAVTDGVATSKPVGYAVTVKAAKKR